MIVARLPLAILILFHVAGLQVETGYTQSVPLGDRLGDLAPPDFAIGGVLGGYDTDLSTSPILDVIRSEFNAVTAKAFMPFGPWPSRDNPIDTFGLTNNVNWARANGKRVHAHVLVYPTENVRLPWFRDLPNDQVESVLAEYVATMAGSSRGDVWVWDVVNEIIGDNGDVMDANGLRIGLGAGDGFVPYKEYAAMGESYVAKAFRWARAADPNAILIVNEYSAETVNDKSDRLLAYCMRLRDQGVPIDGVGFQNHWLDLRYEPNYESIRENFQRFADAGFKIFITELDVAAVHTQDPQNNPPSAEALERHARIFRGLMEIALEQPACKSLLMWDFADEASWLQKTNFTLTLADRRPGFQDTIVPPGTSMFATPFRGGDGVAPIEPKTTYYAMQQALVENFTDDYRIASGWDYRSSYLARFGSANQDGSYSPTGGVYLETLDPSTDSWSSLRWTLERVDTGVFRVRNRWGQANGEDYLTLQGTGVGAALGLQSMDTTWSSQQWFLVETGDGGFRMLNGWSPIDGGLTREAGGLDFFGNYFPGSEVRAYPIQDWSSQIWYFDRIGN